MASKSVVRPLCFAARLCCSRGSLVGQAFKNGQQVRAFGGRPTGQQTTVRRSWDVLRWQKRWHSTPAGAAKVYGYDEVKSLTEKPSSDRILIGMPFHEACDIILKLFLL